MEEYRKNKKKISLLYLLICLIIFSAVLVFYVNSIISVNNLSRLNISLNDSIGKAKLANEALVSEIGKLSSFERIKTIALEKFNLRFSDSALVRDKFIVIKKSETEQDKQ